MTYCDDLSPRQFRGSNDESSFCGLPIFQVGWLEPPHSFPTGNTPAEFAQRLFAFCAWDKIVDFTGGHQDCAFCDATYHQHWTRYHSPHGNGEIRLIGDGVAYAAPSLIYHYVAVHAYLPPPAFVAAVMTGPGPDAPPHRMYRLRCWEALIYSTLRNYQSTPPRKPFPPAKPGVLLDPLIWRYRAIAMVALAAVTVLFARPGGVGVSVPIVLLLVTAGWLLRRQLVCPLCGKRLQLMFREPRGWSLPPDGPYSTMYCGDCGHGFRPTPDLWGAPLAEVATDSR